MCPTIEGSQEKRDIHHFVIGVNYFVKVKSIKVVVESFVHLWKILFMLYVYSANLVRIY